MSDMVEMYKLMQLHKKALRVKFGVDCPACAIARPNAAPSKLLPRQKCKVDGYRDPRPSLNDEDYQEVARGLYSPQPSMTETESDKQKEVGL
jgi:hypothetical protein